MSDKYDDIIADVAVANELPPELVKAIVMVESGFRADAIRFELGFYERYMPPPDAPELDIDEQILRSFSYGLMQIMGQVAMERGFRGLDEAGEYHGFGVLLEPRMNLEWGCLHLVWLCGKLQTYEYLPHIELLAMAYNAGLGAVRKFVTSGEKPNPGYVFAVVSRTRKLRMNYNLEELQRKHGKQFASKRTPIWRCDTGPARPKS